MAWFLGSLIYLALHALVYATVLRPRDAFRRERGIFAYHALSAVGVTLVVLARLALAPSLDTLATVVAVVCLHGIYSTSFLEVWSLSQASYSLKILRHVEETGEGVPIDTLALEEEGVSHRTHRLDALVTLRIARMRGDQIELTALGQLVASALALIAWLANVRQTPAESTTELSAP